MDNESISSGHPSMPYQSSPVRRSTQRSTKIFNRKLRLLSVQSFKKESSDTIKMLGQALYHVVEKSISSGPEDAHIRVFNFLSAAGATEDEKKLIQQAWTRVSMASEAFGKNKSSGPDPTLFSTELIKELSAEKKDLNKLEEMITSFQALLAARETNAKSKKRDTSSSKISSIHDLKKTGGVLANLTSMTKVGKDVNAAQVAAYPSSGTIGDSATSGSADSEESILSHRRSARTAKFIVHGRKPAAASPLYSPLCARSLGGAELVHGDAQYKHSIALSAREKAAKGSAAPIAVMKITSKQPVLQSRAFVSYQCLHEVIPAGDPRWRMFPVPLGCQRNAEQAGPSLVFEQPLCRPLHPLLGSALSVYLRKYPSVALAWCAQMGATMRAFRNCVSGRPMRLPTVQDVFIGDDGHLKVGNAIFEECDYGGDDNSGNSTDIDMTAFFREVLTSSLSLSRSMKCALKPSLNGAYDHEEEDTGDNEDNDENAVENKAARRVDAEEQVLSIAQGNELELHFTGHKCHGMHIMNIGDETKASNRAKLQVHVYGEDATASLESTSGDSVDTTLKVTARKPGNLLVRIVAQADTGSSSSNKSSTGGEGKSNIHFLALDLRIVVVPEFPVQSPELLEVISHLQASHITGNNDMFMSAHAIRLIDTDTGESAPDMMVLHDEVKVHTDWTEIRLQMDQHMATASGATSGRSSSSKHNSSRR